MEIPGRETTTLRTVVHNLNYVARRTQLQVSLAVWRPVISVSLDRWKITWIALIMEVLCLLGCDAVYYDNYNTRSVRRRVLFSQTAKMLPFC